METDTSHASITSKGLRIGGLAHRERGPKNEESCHGWTVTLAVEKSSISIFKCPKLYVIKKQKKQPQS